MAKKSVHTSEKDLSKSKESEKKDVKAPVPLVDQKQTRSTSGKTFFSPIGFLALLIALFSFATNFVVIVSVHSKSSDVFTLPPRELRAYDEVIAIDRELWTPDEPIADWVAPEARPRLLENTFVSHLPMQEWSLKSSSFQSKLPATLMDVQTSPSPYIGPLPVMRKPLGRIDAVQRRGVLGTDVVAHDDDKNNKLGARAGTSTATAMSRDKFFSILSQASSESTQNPSSDDQWVYAEVNIISPALARDIGSTPAKKNSHPLAASTPTAKTGKGSLPPSPLHLTWRELSSKPEGQRTHVWMAKQGAVLGLRQDARDEYISVIEGELHVLLVEPDSLRSMCPYPYLHPAYPYTQAMLHATDFQAASATPASNLAQAYAHHLELCPGMGSGRPRVFEAVVRKGDVLFIPATWGRQVHVHSAALGVVFGSYNNAHLAFEKGLKEIITHGNHDWSEAQRRTAAAVWMHAILSHPNVTRDLPHLDSLRPPTFFNFTKSKVQAPAKNVPSTKEEAAFAETILAGRQLTLAPVKLYDDEEDVVVPGVPPPSPASIFYEREIWPRYGPFLSQGVLSLLSGSENPIIPVGADPNVATISRDRNHDGIRAPAFVAMDLYRACQMRFELTLENPKQTQHAELLKGFGLIPQEAQIEEKPLDNTATYSILLRSVPQFAKHFGPMKPEVRSLHLANLFESMAMWASFSATDASLVAAVLHCMAHSTVNL